MKLTINDMVEGKYYKLIYGLRAVSVSSYYLKIENGKIYSRFPGESRWFVLMLSKQKWEKTWEIVEIPESEAFIEFI